MWILLIGLFCFLFVIGLFVSDNPFGFALMSLMILAGIAFGAFVLFMGYLILKG